MSAWSTVLLVAAREDAFALVAADPKLARRAHRDLRKEVMRRYADSFTLASIG